MRKGDETGSRASPGTAGNSGQIEIAILFDEGTEGIGQSCRSYIGTEGPMR